MTTSDQDILQQQIEYYRARAGEYDEWFLRKGRYDQGEEFNGQWFEEVRVLAQTLERFNPRGDVLELASGTGWWTEQLAQYADGVTCVDASPEVIAVNQERTAKYQTKIRYMQTDLFSWKPDKQYDVVFFSFWLSHVPPDKFENFWNIVRSALKPNGRVFFIDSARSSRGTAKNQTVENVDEIYNKRKLNDGREFMIVKMFYKPGELEEKLKEMGWKVEVRGTENFFVYGSTPPQPSPSSP